MTLLIATLLNPLIALPEKKNSTLEERFYHFVVAHNFSAVFTLYLQSALIQRQALLEIISENAHVDTFIDYLSEAPKNYLSAFFLAVIHAQKAKQAQKNNQLGDAVYNAQSAYDLYKEALIINDKDILLYAKLLDNLQQLSESEATWEHYYQQGLLCDNHNFYLHQVMSNLLQKKGYKGRKKALELARELSKSSLRGNPNHHLIAQAHIQEWLFLGTQKNKQLQKNYFKQAVIKDEINCAYDLFAQQRLRNDCNLEASQNFMFCFYMGHDLLKLTRELRVNRNQLYFSSEPWSHLRFPRVRYNMILRLCGLYPSKPSADKVIIKNIINE